MEYSHRIEMRRLAAVAFLLCWSNVDFFVRAQPTVPGLAPFFAQFPVFGGTLSPMTAPVDEPTPPPSVVAPSPMVLPTASPTGSPVVSPVSVPAPVPVVAPIVPSAGPTTLSPAGITPSPAGTVSPPPTTASPTVAPTAAKPFSDSPSAVPVAPISDPPSMAPSSINGTGTPTAPPVLITRVEDTVENLLLVFPNVSSVSEDDIAMVQNITEIWWTGFYNVPEGRRRLLRGTRMLLRESIANVTTKINITDFGPYDSDNTSSFILYDQMMEYDAFPDANSTEDYAVYPFTDEEALQIFTEGLMEEIPSFANVSGIEAPVVNGSLPAAPTKAPIYDPGAGMLSGGAIAGIAIAISAVLLVGYFVGTTWYHMNQEQKAQQAKAALVTEPSFIGRDNTFISNKGSRAFAQVEKGLFVVYAPTGKLGFSLDKPDDGPLIIYVVKEDSSLVNLIQRGDRLVAVDEENVRSASPAFVVNLLKQRMQNTWRRMTLIRDDETTADTPEGQYIVYAPADKLGFSIERNDDASPPVVRSVKEDSVLLDAVEVGDELLSIDEVDVTGMTAKETVQTLISRKNNASRKLVFRRVMLDSPSTLPENFEPSDEGLYVSFAPAGKLGFSLQSPDEDAMIVYNIKQDSPLVNQVMPGDRLVGIDDVDVRSLSPTRVVNLLSARKANTWRKLTLIRRGAEVSLSETLQLEEGEIVIYVPAGKLGFSLNNPDDGAPVFQIIKDESILAGTVRVGDRLISLDGTDTSGAHSGKVVKLLNMKKDNASRKIVIRRGIDSAAPASDDKAAPAAPVALGPNTYVVKAPAGKLGVILDNPDEGPPVIHSVKETSVLQGQINVGDRLIMIDDVDVRAFSPAQVVQLLSTKSTNEVRLLTMSSGAATAEQEPEIALTDVGSSTMSGGMSVGDSVTLTDDMESGDGKQ